MIAYASRTGTRRNVAALRGAGWRAFLSPGQNPMRLGGWALDNGAWSAFTTGKPWNAAAFLAHLTRWGRFADFVILPDIVAGGLRSLALSDDWRVVCGFNCRLSLLAVQDGMTPADVDDFRVGPRCGIFVGGSTDWKLNTLRQWGRFARERRLYLHVGRVNSARRIRMCALAGADSFDGSSASRYAATLPGLDDARRQTCMEAA